MRVGTRGVPRERDVVADGVAKGYCAVCRDGSGKGARAGNGERACGRKVTAAAGCRGVPVHIQVVANLKGVRRGGISGYHNGIGCGIAERNRAV